MIKKKTDIDIGDHIFEASKQIEFLQQKKTPDQIYSYFKNNKIYNFKENKPDGKRLFDKLFKSKNNIIKLALAEFYPSIEVKEKIFFGTKNKTVRLACLRHKNVTDLMFSYWLEPVTKSRIKFISTASEVELFSYFTHRFFYLNDIKDFVEKKSLYKKIKEKKYNQILKIIRSNPHLSKRPEPFDNELFKMDGLAYYDATSSYDSFFEKFNKLKNKI